MKEKRSNGQEMHLLSASAKWNTGHAMVYDAQTQGENAIYLVFHIRWNTSVVTVCEERVPASRLMDRTAVMDQTETR